MNYSTQMANNTQPLSNITDFALGGDWGKDPSQELDDSTLVKVIRGTEFSNWHKTKAQTAALRRIKKSSLEKRRLKPGDLVIEISGGGPNQPVGRALIIDEEVTDSDTPFVCSNFFRLLRTKNTVDPKYVKYALDYQYLSGEVTKYQTSSTNLRNLNFTDFINKTEIPDIDKDLQTQIANKIEQLEGWTYLASNKIQRAKLLIQKFRQAVLSAAVTGKLTEDWREKNLDSNTWNKLSLSELSPDFLNGISKRSSSIGEPEVVLRLADITNYQVNEGDFRKIKLSEKEKEKYSLKNDDILIIRVNGSKDIVGRFVLYNSSRSYTYCDHFIRLRLNTTKILPAYLVMSSNTFQTRTFIMNNMVSSAGQNTVNQTVLGQIEFNVPSVEEQKEIINRVKSLMALADQAEQQIEKAEKRVDKLTQSILAKAFRGELIQ